MKTNGRALGWVAIALCHWGLAGCGDSADEPADGGMSARTDAAASPDTGTGGTGSPPADEPGRDAGPSAVFGMGPPCRPASGPDLSDLTTEEVYTGDPLGLRVVDDQLFVSDGNTIVRVPLAGGTSEEVVPPGPGNIGGLLANSTHLFFQLDTRIWRVAIDAVGATPEGVYQAGSNEFLRAVDDSHIYLMSRTTSNVGRIAIDSGVGATLVSGVDDRLFSVIDGFAYFSRDLGLDYQVLRVPVAGGSEEELAELPWPLSVASDGTRIYIGGRGGIHEVSPGADPEQIMQRPPAYPANGDIEEMAVSGDRIYWSDDGGSMGWTELDGATCDTIAEWGGGFETWAVGPDSLYVTSVFDVLRLPLP